MPTVCRVPRRRDEDVLFAERLSYVLRALRAASGMSQEEAAEAIGVSLAKLSRWEQAVNAPKGYDLGRVYAGYERWGADWHWFFDPPEVIPAVDPVKAYLDGLARSGAIAADEAEARVRARHLRAVEKRAAARRNRPK